MRLSSDHLEFELKIAGYQFPDLVHESWDSDWLNIRVGLSHAEGRWDHWEKLDPYLTTFEVQWLIEWLSEVSSHAEIFRNWRSNRLTSRIYFTEPNLSFEVLSGSATGKALTFRVYLAAETLPPFKNDLDMAKLEDDPAEVWMDFPVDALDLQEMEASLTQQLALFPVRVGLPDDPSSQGA